MVTSSAWVGEANHNEVPMAITKMSASATLAKVLNGIIGLAILGKLANSFNW